MQTALRPEVDPASDRTEAFIARWRAAGGTELANAQAFTIELCDLLGVPRPEPAREDQTENAYVFERAVTFRHGDGSTSAGRIDCYKRGAFVLEAKRVRQGGAPMRSSRAFDDALLRARAQAEAYARALPASEGRPPFVVVVDVGRVIELYAEFTRSGATYTPFPDARSHRIELAQLADAEVRERLARLWTDPLSLDPTRASAKVTREVSTQLADLAKTLEAAGHAAEHVAAFLTRCLFSMFAEDVGLLPKTADGGGAFVRLLQQHGDDPETLRAMLAVLWSDMDRGGFSAAVAGKLLRFNGKVFKGAGQPHYVLPLDAQQIALLLKAASANWREVEPAIFGTLLERALDPAERHALGAHYTPRAYVERLVLPTVVEPLRAEWADAQAAALLLATEAEALEPGSKPREAKLTEARAEVRRFHHRLCMVRVLDPACGSGNFLYVTLEHMKRLEAEVLNQLHALGEAQGRLGFEGETVTPQQLRGIEVNERAAALAELVLWIGFLQWHIRSFGDASVAEPVIHDYRNIEHRDAVLAWDRIEPMTDADGQVVTRWDGKTTKPHPVTGEPVPDESAQVPQWRYVNPRPADWPQADFIVGNPPFLGSKRMRAVLGDGYVNALQGAWPEVPEATDFVMRWWHHAALRVRRGQARRFGLITSNSIRQAYVRRAVEPHLRADNGLALRFAIADHPWVDSADGAAVRIAMTVGEAGTSAGKLLEVTNELGDTAEGDDLVGGLSERRGVIGPDLRVGANVAGAGPLRANLGLCSVGMKTIGSAFQVDRDLAGRLGLGATEGIDAHIRPYLNGRDFTSTPRSVLVLDFFGVTLGELRSRFPAVYQYLLDNAKPERDQNRNAIFRRDWWVIGHPRPQFRAATKNQVRFAVTVETAKHRVFAFLPSDVVPDSTLVTFALSDAIGLGVLSSTVHVEWSLVAGGTLEDRPRYNKTRCFETFPFPDTDTGLTPNLRQTIRTLAEAIDKHRKERQAAHGGVTLTGLYNVLAKLRSGEVLSLKERALHEHGLVAVLRSLHDELDAAVLAAYSWSDLQEPLANYTSAGAGARAAAVEMLLERLVVLNARRAAEEAAGTVRWLRPEFQNPSRSSDGQQATLEVDADDITDDAAAQPDADDTASAGAPAVAVARRPWPGTLPEQIKAVSDVLASSARPQSRADIEARFNGRGVWRKRMPTILQTLEAIGRAERIEADRWRAI